MKTAYPDVGQIAERGAQIYSQRLRQLLEPTHKGKYVVIDVDSGAFEIDADRMAATDRAREKWPAARLYLARVGYDTVGRIGGRLAAKLP